MRRPAIDPALRRTVAVTTVAAAATVTAIGLRYAGTTGSGALDTRLRRHIARVPAGRGGLGWRVFHAVRPVSLAAAAAALGTGGLLLRRPRLAVVAFGGPVLTGVATTVLKRTFERRSRFGKLAFPSGHAGAVTAVSLVGGLLVADVLVADVPAGRAAVRLALVGAGATAAGAGMGVTLTALGLHDPTDSVGGIATAVAVVGGTALAVDAVFPTTTCHAASPRTP